MAYNFVIKDPTLIAVISGEVITKQLSVSSAQGESWQPQIKR
jgi:hypothetical protein